MTGISTRKVQTGSYQTFINEGGDSAKETVIFLHGSGPGVSARQTGGIYCHISKSIFM